MSHLTDEEKRLLQQAMQGVTPLKADKKIPPPQKSQTIPLQKPIITPEPSARAVQFYDNDHTEFSANIFFARSGLQHRVQQKLRQGKMTPEATLDLHGMIVNEARSAVAEFLTKAVNHSLRVVKIIHGKGGDRGAILRNKVYQWLPQAQCVLAFCSTLEREGGTGAVYVLLKS